MGISKHLIKFVIKRKIGIGFSKTLFAVLLKDRVQDRYSNYILMYNLEELYK